MTSTATQTDIYNMALASIGASARLTTTTTPAGREQEACNLWWPTARDSILQFRAWTFATRRLDMTAISETEATLYGPYEYVYLLPVECLQVLNVFPALADDGTPTEGEVPQDYIVEQSLSGERYLRTDTEDAVLHYVERVADVTLFSPLFVQAVVAQLAAHLATTLKKGNEGARLATHQMELAAKFISTAAEKDHDQYRRRDDNLFERKPDHIRTR